MIGSDVEVDDGSESDQDVIGSSLRNRLPGFTGGPVSLSEWQKGRHEILKGQYTFSDLGLCMLVGLRMMDSSLGHFVRTFSNHAQPPPATEASYDRKGDLLPIHP